MTYAAKVVHPGDRFVQAMPSITTIQLVKYAGASDDYNRIHYDLTYATEAGLGGVIAHGMLTMGFMSSALVAWAGPRAQIKHLAVRFTAPVRPGDVVEVTGAVTATRLTDGHNDAQCDVVARVGERVVAQGEATVRFPE
ncbi:MAG: MaoC/PaaZ C-terminal domain-containing protein [Betaproteobacteria bacterium]